MPPSHSMPSLCGPSRRTARCSAQRACARSAAALLALTGVAAGARADDLLCPNPSTLEACRHDAGVLCPTVSNSAPSTFRETKPDPNAKIFTTSDRVTASLAPNGIDLLEGNVIVRQGDREMRADSARYDRAANSLSVMGGVQFEDPLVRLSGAQGSYSPTTGANVQDARFALRQRPGQGGAQSLDLSPDGVLTLRGVNFTTCQVPHPSWELHAGSLRLDTNQREGTGRDARIEFQGVPVMYLPWLSFPLSDQRKSGFLFPSIGNTSASGVQVEVPYYWNIAPNADLTFDPIYYSRRGVDLSGETRWLQANQSGQLQWHFLPDDRLLDGNDRSLVALHDTLQLPQFWQLRIDAENVSDTAYFQNFGSGPESTSTAFVQRIAQLTYRDENWSLGIWAQQYQVIDLNLADTDRPYARAPRLFADGDFGWGPADLLHYGFDSELVNFTRRTGPTGWRLDLAPRVGLDYEQPGYFVRSSLTWRYTRYALDDVSFGMPTSPTRSLPTASFDSGLQFERPTGADDSRTLTLEPRLLYVYTPFRDQAQLPLFDTSVPDINMVELFRTNHFVGADRVSDANQVTLGVTSRLVNAVSGQQYLAATLGSTYYVHPPQVTLPGELPAGNQTSDLVAEIVLSAYKNWNVDLNLAYNPSAGQGERTFVQLQYKPGVESVVDVAYRYQRSVATAAPYVLGESGAAAALCSQNPLLTPAQLASCVEGERLNQAEVSGAWPVARNWTVFAHVVYDFDANQALDRFAGFEYTSCCWRVRLLGRRYLVNGTGQQDTAVLFQFQLAGLAGVGPASDSFLGSAIRGYSPPSAARSTARSSLGTASLFPP